MSLISRTLSLPTLTPSARRSNAGGSRGGQDAVIQSRRRRRKPRLITGLDIGTTKICAIIGSVDEDGRITVLGMGAAPSRGVRRGTVININETVEAVVSAYTQAHDLAHVHPREVYVGIAGDHISGVNLEGITEIANPNAGVDRRDITRAKERALKMILPNDVEVLHKFTREYVVNERGGITDPIGQFGQRLQVKMHVVTGSISAGNNIFRCVRKAGLRTSGVVLQSVASSLSVLTEREKELGVVLVDIGGGTSDIAIFQGGVLQSISEIAMGGDIITQDIARMLRCSPHDAENLKKKFGHAVPLDVDIDEKIELRAAAVGAKRMTHSRRELAEIIEARAEEILEGVQKEIERSGCADRIYAGVVLTGGTALLEGIGGVAERLLGYPCHIGRPQNMLGMSGVVSTPIYSTAVGLIRWAVQEGETAQRDSWLVRKIKKFFDIYG